MPRAATTTDAFAAIAEPKRREILEVLARGLEKQDAAEGGRDVSWLIEQLGWPQPQVSKHLSVLREVGLVSVERKGKRRMYTLNADELRTVYDWVKAYERFWSHQMLRIKDRAERMQRAARGTDGKN